MASETLENLPEDEPIQSLESRFREAQQLGDFTMLKNVAEPAIIENAALTATIVKQTKLLAQEYKGYCPNCESCGEAGCCSPTNCSFVTCFYGPSNLKAYRDLEREANVMYEKLKELGIIPDDLPGYEEDGV